MDILTVGSIVSSGCSLAVVGASAAAVFMRLELHTQLPGGSRRDYVQSCKRVLSRCIPEASSLTACLAFAVCLRMSGDTTINQTPQEAQVWEQIKRDWPILMGADTLLGLQAMLRLVLVSSVAKRVLGGIEGPGPLSGLPSILAFGGATARAALAARDRSYILDGPLGGDLAIAVEMAAVPLLAAISLPAMKNASVAAKATALSALALWIASNNHLNLARNPDVDQLFTLAHVFEIFAAVAFLCQAVCAYSGITKVKTTAAQGYVYLMMPAQQALAAYYFLTAFEPSPKLVGKGRPFCLLILGGLLMLAVYLSAVAFYLAEDKDDELEITMIPQERSDDSAVTPVQPIAPAGTEEPASEELAASTETKPKPESCVMEL